MYWMTCFEMMIATFARLVTIIYSPRPSILRGALPPKKCRDDVRLLALRLQEPMRRTQISPSSQSHHCGWDFGLVSLTTAPPWWQICCCLTGKWGWRRCQVMMKRRQPEELASWNIQSNVKTKWKNNISQKDHLQRRKAHVCDPGSTRLAYRRNCDRNVVSNFTEDSFVNNGAREALCPTPVLVSCYWLETFVFPSADICSEFQPGEVRQQVLSGDVSMSMFRQLIGQSRSIWEIYAIPSMNSMTIPDLSAT